MGYPLRPPQITLSTRAARLRRPATLARAASEGELDGLGLDLTARLQPPRADDILAAAAKLGLGVPSVWLPQPSARSGWHLDRHAFDSLQTARSTASRVVVELPEPRDGRVSRAKITGATESLRALVGPAIGVAVAVPSPWLVGGRAHLVQMTALRRLAEEWDFDLALDLTGPMDPQWEAEAAVLRLGQRLRLLRLASLPAGPSAPGPRARLSARALAPALELGGLEEIALLPGLAPWHAAGTAALARACGTLADQVRVRFARLVDASLPNPSTNPRARHRT
jgi:hypothetical protein